MAKAKVTFKPIRIADDNWTIQADYPGSEPREITGFAIPTPASQPRAIALGADGNIWFGEFAGGKIGRITPKGEITEFVIPTPNSGPRALAAGPDGNIWFISQAWPFPGSPPELVGRFDLTTHEFTEIPFPLIFTGLGGSAMTSGPDGNLWILGPPGQG